MPESFLEKVDSFKKMKSYSAEIESLNSMLSLYRLQTLKAKIAHHQSLNLILKNFQKLFPILIQYIVLDFNKK